MSPVFITAHLADPLITFVPIKQILSISEILYMVSLFNSVSTFFLTESDSPVSDDCPTYKSFDSNTLKSAGTKLPADNKTISPTVISFTGISFFSPFLITVPVVATNCFNFSAALFDLYSSKNSKSVLVITKTKITIILA